MSPLPAATRPTERALPLNYAICLLDAFSWAIGMALISTTTILPLFLRQLHASNTIIGLLPGLINFGYLLPGMFVSRRISRMPRTKWWLFWVAILERVPLLLIALLTPLLGIRHPATVLWLLIGGFAVHALFLGLNQPAYWVALGKVIPTQQRGKLFGWAGVLSGIVGFGVDPLTRHFLTPYGIASLRGFASCFLAATTILYIGILPFILLKEPRQVQESIDQHQGHYGRDALAAWRANPSLRSLIIGQCLIALAAMSQPFFVLDCSHRFHVTSKLIADFTTIGVVVGAFGSLGWGAWGDRFGNKGVLIASQSLEVAALALAIFSPNAESYYAIFALSALSLTGIGIGSYNIVMEFAGETSQIPFFTTLFNAALSPFRTFSPIFGGILADRFDYPVVFVISAAAAGVSLIFTARMIEPRSLLQRR